MDSGRIVHVGHCRQGKGGAGGVEVDGEEKKLKSWAIYILRRIFNGILRTTTIFPMDMPSISLFMYDGVLCGQLQSINTGSVSAGQRDVETHRG